MTFDITVSAKQAKIASRVVAQLSTIQKNNLLSQIASAIENSSQKIVFNC